MFQFFFSFCSPCQHCPISLFFSYSRYVENLTPLCRLFAVPSPYQIIRPATCFSASFRFPSSLVFFGRSDHLGGLRETRCPPLNSVRRGAYLLKCYENGGAFLHEQFLPPLPATQLFSRLFFGWTEYLRS